MFWKPLRFWTNSTKPVDGGATGEAAPSIPRTFASDALQLYTLNAYAVAQPLFDRLARQVTFLNRQNITSGGVLLTVAAVLLAVPTVMLLIECLAGLCFGARFRRGLHRCTIWILLLCLVLQIIQIVLDATRMRGWGIPGVALLGVAALLSVLAVRLIERSAASRRILSYAAAAIVVFPLAFCLKSGIRQILVPDPVQYIAHVEKPVPIVMVVFDGLCGMALLDEQHEIDSGRYPNFARLGRMSHWYRNATTVHPRTAYALPAILTGSMPRDVLPIAAEYPQNLFHLLHDSGQYELSIFEPSTQLAPGGIHRPRVDRTIWEQAGFVLGHLKYIFLHSTIPADIPPGLPDIPRSWFNLSEEPDFVGRSDTAGAFAYSWDVLREAQVAHFVDCLQSGSRPGFRFLHVVMPHHPWMYLPSGQIYGPRMDVGTYPLGAYGPIGEDWTTDPLVVQGAWQRYLLQLMFADRLVGDMLDRLESTGLLDQCLLVVTADHGEAFVPGLSRREPVGENLPDILPIPLFIKLPAQREGVISDRNVESIDVLPTIADLIGLELSKPVDGRAIFDPEAPPSLRKTFLSGWRPVAISAEFPERYRYVDRMIERFGTGTRDDRLLTFSIAPELVGESIDSFTRGGDSGFDLRLHHGSGYLDGANSNIVPCLFEGQVLSFPEDQPPITLLFSLNGKIAAVTRTVDDDVLPGWWSVLAPNAEFHSGDNNLQVFQLVNTEGGRELRRCRIP